MGHLAHAIMFTTAFWINSLAAGHKLEPTLDIMDGQSVKTSERGVRGFDGHKRPPDRAAWIEQSGIEAQAGDHADSPTHGIQ